MGTMTVKIGHLSGEILVTLPEQVHVASATLQPLMAAV